MKPLQTRFLVLVPVLALAMPVAQVADALGRGDDFEVVIQSTVTPNGDLFDYSYQIISTTGPGFSSDTLNFPIEDGVGAFLLPLFDDPDVAIVGGTAGLRTPIGWNGAIVSGAGNWNYDPGLDPDSGSYGVDPMAFVDPPLVIQFAATDLVFLVGPDGAQDGFGFTSPFGPGDGPSVVILGDEHIIDPHYIASPNSPHGTVPEPVTSGLAALSLIALGGYVRRRKS